MNGLALCAGVGGLELGLSIACPGYRAVCVVEGEAYSAATLARRMEDGLLEPAPIYSDVRTFDGRPWRGLVDIVTAGYPCQPFSLAGKRLGEKDPRHLWPDVRRIIEETAPSLVFCENVSAHLRHGFDTVCKDMDGLGYRVAAGVFTAWAVGAPHLRERLFWLASNSLREPLREQQRRKTGACRENSTLFGADGDSRKVAEPDGEQVEWSTVARQECNPWTVEPDVGRVANGVAHRVDRLRAIGNGVVPAVAARAFITLLGELI